MAPAEPPFASGVEFDVLVGVIRRSDVDESLGEEEEEYMRPERNRHTQKKQKNKTYNVHINQIECFLFLTFRPCS
jgi:hypothetical protein